MEETTHYTGEDFGSLVDLTARMGKICAELEDGGNKSVVAARIGLRAIITHSIDKQVEQLGSDYLDCLWAAHKAAQESGKAIVLDPIYTGDESMEVSARWEIMCVLEQMIGERWQAAA
jgi:hypothetical protein